MSKTVVADTSVLRPELRERSLWKDALRRFRRNKLSVAALTLVLLLTLMALSAGFFYPNGYDNQVYTETWEFPSAKHPMGTDPFGRDVLGRIMYGARISLAVAIVVNLTALVIGMPLGAAAGWFGGAMDYALMRIVDIMSTFPTLLFAILLMSMLGSGLVNVFIAMSVTGWISIARLVRGQVLSLREQEYTVAARAIGSTDWHIILRHMVPNSLTPIIVSVTLGIPSAIMGEAGLSFLGVGVNAPMPSWGKMLNEYVPYMQTFGYLSLFPALMIAITMYAFTLMGDGLRDALDPSLKS
jgi:ABC-type dipeptide/oligopeptide/nickel transport system permease subunit